MGTEIKTIRGYDFYVCSSALQKAIRRADTKLAGYFALELWKSGYGNYVWKRLYTISAEDCFGIITKEVEALHKAYEFINKNVKEPKGRLFISKCVILLCMCKKNRDADLMGNFVYDRRLIDENELNNYIKECESEPKISVPDYVFDCHTKQGKMRGRTKEQFFHEEQMALFPKTESQLEHLLKHKK